MISGKAANTSLRSRRCTKNMVKAVYLRIDNNVLISIGPIVRVNPEELSISDPDFYNEIYVTESKRRTNSYDVFCKGIDFDGKYVSKDKSVKDVYSSYRIPSSHRRAQSPSTTQEASRAILFSNGHTALAAHACRCRA
jgi:hypothetical protein